MFCSQFADMTQHSYKTRKDHSALSYLFLPCFHDWQLSELTVLVAARWSAQGWLSGLATFLQGSLCGIWQSQADMWCRPLDSPGMVTVEACHVSGGQHSICRRTTSLILLPCTNSVTDVDELFNLFPWVESAICSVARSI